MDDGSGISPWLARWWRSIPPLAVDTVLAAVVLVVGLVEIAVDDEPMSGRERVLGVALLVAMSAVIVVRRRHPVAVWLVSGILVSIYGVAPLNDPVLFYGPLIAVYTVAAYTTWRTAVIAGIVTAVAVALSMIVDPHDDLVDWLVAFLSTTTAWLVGNNVRTYRAYTHELEAKAARLERDRRADAERAVAEERLRLARELHDVAAHHVSVIALHAEAGQSLLPDQPERADQSLAVIGQVARTTLTELRRVVGVLRDDGAAPLVPQPGLDHLPTLVREVERAGVPVTLKVSGTPGTLSRTLDTSAYRIVQEALTNVLRHAGPATAQVSVTYEPDAVAVEVLDDGVGRAGTRRPAGADNGGHGIAGMRERAAMFGGTLTAAARPERGFAVSARLPR